MNICGACLHDKEAHEKHNGHFMYCACCMSLCDLDEFDIIHSPTDLETTMRIGALKQ